MTRTTESITSGQKERIAQLVIDELISLGANKDSAQRIITKGGDLQVAVREQLLDLGAMRYKDETVESTYTYPVGYAPKPVCEQLLSLKNVPLFSGLDASKALSCSKQTANLPTGAEFAGVFPPWQRIASTYNEATETVLRLLGKSRTVKNWREGKLGSKYMRLVEKTDKALATLNTTQNSDFLIVPVQFGLGHRGESVRRARELESTNPKGFLLGPYEVGVLLLSHPERLIQWEQLHVDCGGAEYSPPAAGGFDDAPFFRFGDDGVGFSAAFSSIAGERYGSASGFLP